MSANSHETAVIRPSAKAGLRHPEIVRQIAWAFAFAAVGLAIGLMGAVSTHL